MATAEQIKDYAENLPSIYRDILASFPRLEPTRRSGYGLAFQTLAADLEGENKGIRLGEIIQACEALKQRELVEIKNRIFVHPTELGESVIAAITGRQSQAIRVPELPAPPA
jgi:hypothetical protein